MEFTWRRSVLLSSRACSRICPTRRVHCDACANSAIWRGRLDRSSAASAPRWRNCRARLGEDGDQCYANRNRRLAWRAVDPPAWHRETGSRCSSSSPPEIGRRLDTLRMTANLACVGHWKLQHSGRTDGIGLKRLGTSYCYLSTPIAIALPRICCRRAQTSSPYRNCLATPTCTTIIYTHKLKATAGGTACPLDTLVVTFV
jgi:hypothetical protein